MVNNEERYRKKPDNSPDSSTILGGNKNVYILILYIKH